MEVNELRSGNWIDTKDFHIDEFKGLYQYDPEWYKYVHMFEPIPLTEEWLIKFGFKISKYGFPTKNNFQVGHVTTDENYQFEYSLGTIGKWILKDIKYVHQLQNLYFALTGEELTLTK